MLHSVTFETVPRRPESNHPWQTGIISVYPTILLILPRREKSLICSFEKGVGSTFLIKEEKTFFLSSSRQKEKENQTNIKGRAFFYQSLFVSK